MMRSSFIAAALALPLSVANATVPAVSTSPCAALQDGGYAGYLLPTVQQDREEFAVVRLQFNDIASQLLDLKAVVFNNLRQSIKIERPAGAPERFDYKTNAQSWPEGDVSLCRTSAARTLSCREPGGNTISLRLTDDNAEIVGAATVSGAVCPLQWRIEN